MRRPLAGILFLLALVPITALADTKGEVESIGFQGLYRPNCHIPMLVRVQADKSGTYYIRVVQEDMDRDQQLFTQQVSLTGSEEGKGVEQRFWLYFIPQPTEGGLTGGDLRQLQQELKVFLCDEKGRQICQLPVTQSIINLESPPGAPIGGSRGGRLVLAVSDSLTQQPQWRDYDVAMGMMESVVFVPARSTDLPEDVRGYESVDAIVWLNAPPPDRDKATDQKRYHALRQYVRGGGHLVICQPPQREATGTFDDLMPVTVKAIAPRDSLEPLKTIATEKLAKQQDREKAMSNSALPAVDENPEDRLGPPSVVDWERPTPPFMYARGETKPGAIVEEQIKWDAEGKDKSPWLARIGYGAGCVSWVAQDLSDVTIVNKARSGWPFVWEKVLDYKSDLLLVNSRTMPDAKRPYEQGGAVDISQSLLGAMELASKSRALVSIAVVFFIAYWVVAGPGVYFYLLTRSRPQLSWFLFAFSALVATVLTVLVVRLVVRGAPELAHVTVIRTAPGEPPICFSRFGLYIPRDGTQEIKLPDIAPREVSYLTAYPEHPAHAQGDIEFPAQIPYVIPLRDANSDDPVAIDVPYRSTLKKFQARRVGPVAGVIDGKPKLREGNGRAVLEGIITNGTGRKLRNVYIAYSDPQTDDDVILYAPTWESGANFTLETDFALASTKFVGLEGEANNRTGYPQQGFKLQHVMGRPGVDFGWSRFWYASDRPLRNVNVNNMTYDDADTAVPKSFPMLSLFQRLPPMKNYGGRQQDRSEILRRGGRYLDVSNEVAAGRLVVLAEVDGDVELPFPLEVDGEKVAGKGKVLYQCALALDHVGATALPSTQPIEEQKSAEPPPFDPANYNGDLSDLTPDQRREVQQYRMRQRMPQRPPVRRPTPPPQRVRPAQQSGAAY
jgi:hypothetical protein